MDLFDSNLAATFSGLNQLLGLYRQLDLEITKLKKLTGLDCLPSCRSCCSTPELNIEVTLFELIPLSIRLWERNEAEFWLARTATVEATSPCMLFAADPKESPFSGCRYYQLRPLICRLFGFGAIHDKFGRPQAVICKRLKLLRPESALRVQELIETGFKVPDFSSLTLSAAALNPYLSETRYPINQALNLALELVGYRRSLLRQAGESNGKCTSSPNPHLGRTA